MNMDILRFRYEHARDRDSFELSLGDALDVKGSILLAAIAIMATLSGYILGIGRVPELLRLAQVLSVAILSIGGILTIGELWPRDYLLYDTPEAYSKWMSDIESRQNQPAGGGNVALIEILQGAVEIANEGITENHRINKRKSALLNAAFYSVVASLIINLGSLLFVVTVLRQSN